MRFQDTIAADLVVVYQFIWRVTVTHFSVLWSCRTRSISMVRFPLFPSSGGPPSLLRGSARTRSPSLTVKTPQAISATTKKA